jgi:hypothetical protein
MKLLTKANIAALAANAEIDEASRKPVVKFFDPTGAATWLISEMDGDLMFGLCDLGMGSPELGYVSLEELKSVKGAFGLGIERDLYFEAKKTLVEYSDAARAAGKIAA